MNSSAARVPSRDMLLVHFVKLIQNFNFSSGWLDRFKARHGIKSYRHFGESGSVVMENIEIALPGIRAQLDQFHRKDIYNLDETELFFGLEADHSLATKQLKGHKKDNERITIAISCNGDSSDKVPLWIIAHPQVIKGLTNVELFFLSPNTISKIQPYNAEIIRALKIYYRCRFHSSILEGYEVEETNPEKINILNATKFINTVWNIDVKITTIANCFRHYKIRSHEDMDFEPQVGEDEGIDGLREAISGLRYRNVMDVGN
ncbi:hypothetical protein Ddye_020100 [Dipteronia dyeriana]|uniref:HTH CENPB-type domain-containing protein n=1 Tax=Dipteronia dyeriana TaxID=168575 RepID=A0AAD9U053_9ROSI|nr:hypothetical protein Ddye_020100 [Dipteronia dyeriana]